MNDLGTMHLQQQRAAAARILSARDPGHSEQRKADSALARTLEEMGHPRLDVEEKAA